MAPSAATSAMGRGRCECHRRGRRTRRERRRWCTKRRVAAGNGHSRGRTGRIGYPGFRGNRRSSRPPFGYALLKSAGSSRDQDSRLARLAATSAKCWSPGVPSATNRSSHRSAAVSYFGEPARRRGGRAAARPRAAGSVGRGGVLSEPQRSALDRAAEADVSVRLHRHRTLCAGERFGGLTRMLQVRDGVGHASVRSPPHQPHADER